MKLVKFFILLPIFLSYLCADSIQLTNEEKEYLSHKGTITMCVDPDWEPYEMLNSNGTHIGIAADLIRLVAQRVGIEIHPLKVSSWNETLELSQSGKCDILSFVNDTPERRKWLTFTSPLLEDQNIFIAKRGFQTIKDPKQLNDKTIVLIEGSSILEKVKKEYPNLKIIPVVSEKDAFEMVSNNKADLTLRSLIMSAYTIRKEGYFNLEVVGFSNDEFTNRLRIGVLKTQPILRNILDKGVQSITENDRKETINNHVYIKIEKGVDYTLVWQIIIVVVLILIIIFIYIRKLQILKKQLNDNYKNLEKFIDMQDNIVILTNGKDIQHANRSFFEFFGYRDLPHFKEKFNCICDKFMENDQFFHLGKLEKDETWVQHLLHLPHSQRIVGMLRYDFSIQAFSASINKYDKDLYIVSFANITQTILCNIELQDKTIRDKLTGAYNREYFEQNYKQILNNTVKSGSQLALAFLDIDHFKSVNDTYGHDVGDEVLIHFVEIIKKFSRDNDILIRWGGEEFILLLKVKSQEGLKKALEHLRQVIENTQFPTIGRKTCSIGGTIYKDNEDILTTIKRADICVYEAKETGRNKVVIK